MKNKIEIEPRDLYQFLLFECRYGYTRNNHLMPDAAFSHCKEFLPKQYACDKKLALHTAKQLCEECVNGEITTHFYDGDDDEFGNRESSIKFVYWLLDWIKEKGDSAYKPYNYDLFLENVSLDEKPQYFVFELFDFDFETRKWLLSKMLNEEKPLSKKKYLDFILTDVCGLGEGCSITFRKINLFEDEHGFRKPTKFIYQILLDIQRTFLITKEANKRPR